MSRWISGRFTGMIVALAMLAVLTVGTASTALAADVRNFTLVNASNVTINEVYVSPSTSDDWGSDVLGSSVLRPGRQTSVDFSRVRLGTCYYDIKIVSAAGSTTVRKGINLCTTYTVTYQ